MMLLGYMLILSVDIIDCVLANVATRLTWCMHVRNNVYQSVMSCKLRIFMGVNMFNTQTNLMVCENCHYTCIVS
mgnify:FL=1